MEVVRPHHRDDDTILVPPLTSVRRQDIDILPLLKQVRQQLDLLTIQRDHADLLLVHAAAEEAFSELVHEAGFGEVLREVADLGVVCGHGVGVDEDGFAAGWFESQRACYDKGGMMGADLGSSRRSNQHAFVGQLEFVCRLRMKSMLGMCNPRLAVSSSPQRNRPL